MKHRFPYEWTLKDAKFTKDKGKVFTCFAGGGGSSLGYKLAGFDVIGFNEIYKKQAGIYQMNNEPKYAFIEPIQDFKLRNDLPEELYNLDILDGSPPCSTFSISGNREEDWGKARKFREGQQEQVLDTLFFDFIDLAKKLQPKMVIAENVKGILLGEAFQYVKKIYEAFDEAGYIVKHFLLNANRMGVPQSRERVFFIAIRKDLSEKLPQNEMVLFENFPILDLVFFEDLILFDKIIEHHSERPLNEGTKYRLMWDNRKFGDADFSDVSERLWNKPNSYFNHTFVYKEKVCYTIASSGGLVLFDQARYLNKNEILKVSSFPLDYKFSTKTPQYECGMSVPPVMMAQVASRIYEQWLKKINQ